MITLQIGKHVKCLIRPYIYAAIKRHAPGYILSTDAIPAAIKALHDKNLDIPAGLRLAEKVYKKNKNIPESRSSYGFKHDCAKR